MSRRVTAPAVQLKQLSRASCPLTGPWHDGAPSALQEEKGSLPLSLTTWKADNISLTINWRTANFAFVPSLPKIPTAFRTLVSDTGCTFSQPFESQQLRKTRFNLFSVQYLQFIITDADSCICCHGSQFHAWPADSVIPVFAVLIRTSLWSWNTHTQLSNSVPTAGSCSHELIHRLR